MVTGWAGERRTTDHLAAWATRRAGRRRRPGHRSTRTAPAGPAHPRGPPRWRLHHRRAAEPRAPAPRGGRPRAVVIGAELVSWSAVLTLREAGCATVAMTSELPARRGLCRLPAPGPRCFGRPVLAAHPDRRHQRPTTASPRSTSRTSTPANDAASTATPSSPPATGSPTTSWPVLGGLDLDPGHPRAASSTPPWHPGRRGLRGRQPPAPGRHRRRRGARRPTRRPQGRRLAAHQNSSDAGDPHPGRTAVPLGHAPVDHPRRSDLTPR